MEPLASYRGTWLQGSYLYELFPDSLRVVGKEYLVSDSDLRVPLAGLQVRADRVRQRSSMFQSGLWYFAVTLISWPVVVAVLRLEPLSFGALILASPGVSGLITCLAAAPKTMFACFVTDAGVAAVAIPRTQGGDGFDAFIDKVLAQIRIAKASLPEKVD